MLKIRGFQDPLRRLLRLSSAAAKIRVDTAKRVVDEFVEGAEIEGFLVNKVGLLSLDGDVFHGKP